MFQEINPVLLEEFHKTEDFIPFFFLIIIILLIYFKIAFLTSTKWLLYVLFNAS